MQKGHPSVHKRLNTHSSSTARHVWALIQPRPPLTAQTLRTPQNAPRLSAPPPTHHLATSPCTGERLAAGAPPQRESVWRTVSPGHSVQRDQVLRKTPVCQGSLRSRSREAGGGEGRPPLPLGCPGSGGRKASGPGRAQAVASMGQVPPNCCYFVPFFEQVLLNPSKLVHSPVQSDSFSPTQAGPDQGKRKGETRCAGQGAPRMHPTWASATHEGGKRVWENVFSYAAFWNFSLVGPRPDFNVCVCVCTRVYAHMHTHTSLQVAEDTLSLQVYRNRAKLPT